MAFGLISSSKSIADVKSSTDSYTSILGAFFHLDSTEATTRFKELNEIALRLPLLASFRCRSLFLRSIEALPAALCPSIMRLISARSSLVSWVVDTPASFLAFSTLALCSLVK